MHFVRVQDFPKTNNFYRQIQGVRNVNFLEDFVYVLNEYSQCTLKRICKVYNVFRISSCNGSYQNYFEIKRSCTVTPFSECTIISYNSDIQKQPPKVGFKKGVLRNFP